MAFASKSLPKEGWGTSSGLLPGGAFDPAASSRPPPGQRSHSVASVEDVVGKLGLFFVWVVSARMCDSLSALCLVEYRPLGPAKSWVYIFLGYLLIVRHVACFCATGGGSRGGGVFGPLGTTVPWCRAAHGPRHPAVIIPLRLCMLGVCSFC